MKRQSARRAFIGHCLAFRFVPEAEKVQVWQGSKLVAEIAMGDIFDQFGNRFNWE